VFAGRTSDHESADAQEVCLSALFAIWSFISIDYSINFAWLVNGDVFGM